MSLFETDGQIQKNTLGYFVVFQRRDWKRCRKNGTEQIKMKTEKLWKIEIADLNNPYLSLFLHYEDLDAEGIFFHLLCHCASCKLE